MHSWSFLAAIFIWSSLVILPYGLIVSNDLGKVTQFDWVMLVGMSVIPGIVGHGLMTWSQSHLDVTLASILGLLSPVVSTGLAWIIFSQSLTGLQMLGAVVVLGSLTLLVREQRAFSLPVLERET
jgi:drug/metabolite transporter (DMT)-like permease